MKIDPMSGKPVCVIVRHTDVRVCVCVFVGKECLYCLYFLYILRNTT